MIAFQPMSITERIKRLWPPYRRRRDAAMKEAIKQLVANPQMPCKIGDHIIPDGYSGMFGGPR